jgi:hypothetical protein
MGQTQTYPERLERPKRTANNSNQTSTASTYIPVGRIAKVKAAENTREGPRISPTDEPGQPRVINEETTQRDSESFHGDK